MDKKLYDLIIHQINQELYSAYAYYAIAEFYREKGLNGFHSWFEKQAHEELEHAERFSQYLQDNGENVTFKAIEALDEKFDDFRAPLLFQIKHEAYVTSLINEIYKRASSMDDYAATNFLDWFIAEQMEEEKHSRELLIRYDLFAKEGGAGLFKLDYALGERK